MSTQGLAPGQTGLAPPFLRELLVPTDPWEGSDAPVQAARLAVRLGSRLTLYHALEFPDHEDPHWAFGERASVWSEEERLAREFLADAAEGLGVAHREVVERVASPVRALLNRIKATAPDLVVMAPKGRGAVAHALVGSVTEEIVRGARSPVLGLRGTVPLDRQLAGTILLVTDLSEDDRPAVRMAGLLAGTFGGELHLLYSPAPARGGREETWQPYAAVERWLGAMPGGVRVRFVVEKAPSHKAVLRMARHENAGLVVLPRRRGPGPEPVGGPPERMVQHAPCSVLVV